VRNLTVRWRTRALTDVIAIRRYIAQDNPNAAKDVSHRLVSGTDVLSTAPLLGRDTGFAGVREYIFADIPYVALYRVDAKDAVIDVLRVLHMARQRPPRRRPS
jgi:addiction module RelE/StbE family toxin